ncbi:hypothetical protein PISMIDRAFT_686935 [Pisolithus microcarpus 441]|uniref:Unplaced genomic scaffold scaffold_191, whole genome shotgun sequence n=1 Tax=Pisolithus microcarpus 441 TaxID=765257 RepID=A0A0C9YPX4_9AGAM|nr:hypothetical protein BKA83DRAFT_686935 [Pisolithus microcarpus]KIK15859.1 hypothetical protein PISMIDRAFT_686935 [Pisolithus microcarpus 441]
MALFKAELTAFIRDSGSVSLTCSLSLSIHVSLSTLLGKFLRSSHTSSPCLSSELTLFGHFSDQCACLTPISSLQSTS